LLVLASKPQGRSPSQRFRLEQWAPRLERDHGISLHFAPFESAELAEILNRPGRLGRKALLVVRDFVRRSAVLAEARRYDGLIIHREAALIGPAFYERLLSWMGCPFLFDFDDSIWSSSQEANNGLFSRLHFFGKTSDLCRMAAACTPGNAFLADYAKTWNSNSFVVPTTIDLDRYPHLSEPDAPSPFIVCWTGSTSTLVNYESARAALERLAREVPLCVKVICNVPPQRPIEGAENVFTPWSEQGEAEEIGASHVGIMPLSDNEVTRGKCGLKALQCMATGRPVVVSPVGVNSQIVEHGRNGFLAATDSEMVEALRRLWLDAGLRARLGKAARRTVEQGYSAEIGAARMAAVIRFVTDHEPRPA
jgi:glycosyltransferase involved in cell wall biosynthesis